MVNLQERINGFLGGIKLPEIKVQTQNKVGIEDNTQKYMLIAGALLALVLFTRK